MSDKSETHYYTAARVTSGVYRGKVYHYDATGNVEIVVWTSPVTYSSEFPALDAAVEWCEENGISAELG